MAKSKSRILHLLRYLEQYTDEDHPARIHDIIAHLKTLDIPANRNTVADDISCLEEAGVDIVCNRGRSNAYFIGSRHFELPELKLLVDAVQAAHFIPAGKSRALVEKLSAFASDGQVGELQRGLYIDRQIKATNEHIYIITDMLYTAINDGKRIQFKYFEYSETKQKQYKHDGAIYELSPYGLIWNNDRYYVAGYCERHGKVVTFRVDRIAVPQIIEKPAREKPDTFVMSEYANTFFQMYDGPLEMVTLLCENSLMKAVIDRFGEDVDTDIHDKGHFTARIKAGISRTFYSWVFSFNGGMEILAPPSIVNEFRDMAMAIVKKSP